MYQACRKSLENWSWPFSLISDGFLRPAVILPSRPVGGVWLRDYLLCFATCTWPTTLPSFSTATACRSKEFSSSTALQSTRIRGRGGGLNCKAKAQVLVVTPPPPPPLFFLKVSQKGGGVTAGQYGTARSSGAEPFWSHWFSGGCQQCTCLDDRTEWSVRPRLM